VGWNVPIDESPESVRAALAPLRNKITVAAVALGNAFAAGAIIRVAHSFLVRDIVLVGDAPFYEKASMGMEKYETIVRVPDASAFVAHIGTRPLYVLEGERARGNFYLEPSFPEDAVFLFGSERHGVPQALLDRADRILALPMYGVNHSFPVAIAAGMVLGEWARRRYAPGTTL
jgi:tRNA G18 (ribose-2'-O)-methylase SpoU